MASARVFVHPRCFTEPALGALATTLEAHGFDMTKVKIGPMDSRRRCELVRPIAERNAVTLFERMDKSRFIYRAGEIVHTSPALEAA